MYNTDDNQIYFFDDNNWIALSSITKNLYIKDGNLSDSRVLDGNTKSLTFNNLDKFELFAQNGIVLNGNTEVSRGLILKEFLEDSSGSKGKNGQVLTSTSEGTKWEDKNLASVVIKNSNYILAPTDSGKVFVFDSSTDIILTVPKELPVGFNISIYQINNGKVTIKNNDGVNVLNRLGRKKTAGKNAGAGLICIRSNTFYLTGDLKK
ncbi:MAG: hypothetical protein ACK5H1_10045 [Tenacibaculum sp.]